MASCVPAFAENFNSRPSARGDQPAPSADQHHQLFQFTPLREGRHPIPAEEGGDEISIHAPPRGATCFGMALHSRFVFQFTPLREGRPDGTGRDWKVVSISIHAPPRGATREPADDGAGNYFNSRPSARGDGKRYAISANLLFNPYKSAWLNNSATQFVEIILVIFHRIIA